MPASSCANGKLRQITLEDSDSGQQMDNVMFFIQIMVFLIGVFIVASTIFSAVRTLVLPRGAPDRLYRFVFLSMRRFLEFFMRRRSSYIQRDRVMAFYAPFGTIALLPVWLTFVLLGYMFMYWALGESSWYQAFRVSGSSLLTLGYASADQFPETILEFTEATIGLMLIAIGVTGYCAKPSSQLAKKTGPKQNSFDSNLDTH